MTWQDRMESDPAFKVVVNALVSGRIPVTGIKVPTSEDYCNATVVVDRLRKEGLLHGNES